MALSTRASHRFQCRASILKFLLPLAVAFFIALFLASTVTAQSDKELGAYLDMVNRFKAQGDVLELERYVSTAPPGYLRTNALELLAWQYRKIGDRERALKWANELAAARPENALALALMADTEHDLTQTSPAEAGGENRLSLAKRALRGIDQLQPIEGMSGDEFSALKKDLTRSLNGAVGYAYYQRNDYVTARNYLRKSVALAPDNAQYVYALAIADLYGNPPAKDEGYRLLAQSVNMNKGTPAGEELAKFARQRYQEEGGKSSDWDIYLANTPAPPRSSQVIVAEAAPAPVPAAAQPVPAPSTPTGGTSGTAASTQPPPTTSTTTTAASASSPATSAPASTTTATVTSPVASAPGTTTTAAATSSPATRAPASTTTATASSPPTSAPATAPATTTPSATTTTAAATNTTAQGGGIATSTKLPPTSTPSTTPKVDMSERVKQAEQNVEIASAKTTPLPPRPPRKLVPAGAPVSMGILIETAATSRDTRDQVVHSLTDMVRHLRETDEAFVVSFSRDVTFEQDLTNNPGVLEKAMDNIKPMEGTALFDAVAFAAGHLNRVARNSKRVLIVVSDGSNHTNRISPLELSGELNVSGVEIYCIGLGADTTEDQYRLQALAQRTGGRTVFSNDGAQFRSATRQVAEALGIPF